MSGLWFRTGCLPLVGREEEGALRQIRKTEAVTRMGKTQLGLSGEASTRGLQAGNVIPRKCARWFIGVKRRNTSTAIYIRFISQSLKKYTLCISYDVYNIVLY